jgi:hypothetical protein
MVGLAVPLALFQWNIKAIFLNFNNLPLPFKNVERSARNKKWAGNI